MIRWRPPATEVIERRREAVRRAPLSCRADVSRSTRPTGSTPEGRPRFHTPTDFVAGEWEIDLGDRGGAFEAACRALEEWRQFPPALIEPFPADTPLEVGETVMLVGHALGVHADFACRIIDTIDARDAPRGERRFGFSYATIEGHVERGAELFLIDEDRDGRVTYRIRAHSRPAHPLAWIIQPWIRSAQRRFGVDSARALRTAIGAPAELPAPRLLVDRPSFGLPWIGALLWLVSVLVRGLPWQTHVVPFVALVLLPAARALWPERLLRGRTIDRVWLISATTLAFIPSVGVFLWGGLAAIGAAAALRAAPVTCREDPRGLGGIVGLLLLPVGCAWAIGFEIGWWPGGFPPFLAELTAIHFHTTGAIVPIIVAAAFSRFGRKVVLAALLAFLGATATVAIGITLSPTVELIGALALIALLFAVATLQARDAFATPSSMGRVLLGLGAIAWFVGLGLALTYAVGEWRGAREGMEPYQGGGILSWTTMLRWHGPIMLFGGALLSILGRDAEREVTRVEARS